MNVVRVILFPIALYAAIMHCCYEVFWYCAIVGRPSWLVGAETPLQATRDTFRDTFTPRWREKGSHQFFSDYGTKDTGFRTCCGHCWGDRKCSKCPVHGRRS